MKDVNDMGQKERMEETLKSIEKNKKELDWAIRDLELTKELRAIQLDGYSPLEAKWEYERNPKYNEAAKKLQVITNEKEVFLKQALIDQIKQTLCELEVDTHTKVGGD